jgi:hypothetical protein
MEKTFYRQVVYNRYMSENLTPWQKYKQDITKNKPWHLLNNANYTSKEIQENRFSICKICPEIIKPTYQCKQCGCFMKAKTILKDSVCPIGKW